MVRNTMCKMTTRKNLSCAFAILFSIFFNFAPNFALAAEALNVNIITIKDAIDTAIKNNPAIIQAKEKLNQDREATSLIRASLFPTLNVVGTGLDKKDSTATSGVNAPFNGQPYNNYNIDLHLNQPLFGYGSLAAVRNADYDRQVDIVNVEIAERNLENQVIQAFYVVILDQKLLELLNRHLEVLQETLKTSQGRYQTGRGQLLDVLQVKTQIALLKPQIISAQNSIVTSAANLTTLMGGVPQNETKLRGKLVRVPLNLIDSRVDLTHTRLPELESIRLRRLQLNELKDQTLGKHFPSLALVGDVGSNSFTKADIFSSYSQFWSVGLQLTIPIFSGFSSSYEQRALASQDYQLESSARGETQTLQLAQLTARKTLESSDASLASAEEASNLARESVAEAKRNYRLATIDFLVFLTVQTSQLTADQSFFQTEYNTILAMANYFVASGQSLSKLVDLLLEKK